MRKYNLISKKKKRQCCSYAVGLHHELEANAEGVLSHHTHYTQLKAHNFHSSVNFAKHTSFAQVCVWL